MKNDLCPSPEEIGALLELPATDARRSHLDSCARCAALLLQYEAFQSDDRTASLSATESRALQRTRERLSGQRIRTSRARWVPRLSLGAAAIAAGLALFLIWPAQQPEPGVLRGETTQTLRPTIQPEGEHWQLQWQAHPGADAYALVVQGSDGSELRRIELGAVTQATLTREGLPSDGMLLLRVLALRDGDVVERSPAQALR